MVTRNAKRRGAGWLGGQADIGYSNRLGWYEGFNLLGSVSPDGVLTGFGFAPASTKDQTVAETFFAARATEVPGLLSVGRTHPDRYVCDKGFEGQRRHRHWRRTTAQWWSARHSAMRSTDDGPRRCGAGWPASGRSSRA